MATLCSPPASSIPPLCLLSNVESKLPAREVLASKSKPPWLHAPDLVGEVICSDYCSGANRWERQLSGLNNILGEVIGGRPVVATGSHDGSLRLWLNVGDEDGVEPEGYCVCIAVLEGHNGPVLDLKWEAHVNYAHLDLVGQDSEDEIQPFEADWEPRLVSCGDDLTIRTWKRDREATDKEQERLRFRINSSPMPLETPRPASQSGSDERKEVWRQDEMLPQSHNKSIYALDWSRKTGLIVSCGGDGKIIVYQEVAVRGPDGFLVWRNYEGWDIEEVIADNPKPYITTVTEWKVAALMDPTHDSREMKHVFWAARAENERRIANEEVIISIREDGVQQMWALPADLL